MVFLLHTQGYLDLTAIKLEFSRFVLFRKLSF